MRKINCLKSEELGQWMKLVLLLFFFTPQAVHAQLRDNIYLVDEEAVRGVDIMEVSANKVRYRNKEGKVLSQHSKNVLIAFNGHGKYLVFPIKRAEEVEAFLSREVASSGVDLIVTLSGSVIPAYINDENELEIDFHDLHQEQWNKKLSFSELAAIIYKDGNHKLFTSPSQASSILSSLNSQVYTAQKAAYVSPEDIENRIQKADPLAKVEASVLANPETPLFPEAEKKSLDTLDFDYELYSRKAIQKTADLSTYLEILTDKSVGQVDANNALELAVRLFINEDAEVEVTGLNGRARYKVRTYLNRLKVLKYDKIEITWTDIYYLNNLVKGADGNYHGTITFQQRFKGFMDGKVVYGDVTKKNVMVTVKVYKKGSGGEEQEKWDVFLSNIGVVVTNLDK